MPDVMTLEKSSGSEPPRVKGIASGFADDDEDKIKRLGNKVARLTLAQAAKLSQYLRSKLGKKNGNSTQKS